MSHAESFLASRDDSIYGAKRWLWLLGFVPPALAVFGALLAEATGLPLFYWFGLIFVYGVVAVIVYHLPRHSDHHAYPMRRYHALRHFDEAPQLPTGNAGMSALTLFPRCGRGSWTRS